MSLKVKIIEHTPNPEKVIASAGKLCYSSANVDDIMDNLDEESTKKFVNMIMSYGHFSTIEHVSFTFAIEGVSRSLTHQLVRHRLASYSQQSQRYVKLKQFEYIIPPEIEGNIDAKELFIECMKKDQETYDKLVDILKKSALDAFTEEFILKNKLGSKDEVTEKDNKKLLSNAEKKAIEDARYVFPNACETKIIMTMNARELIHFFNERCCQRAQWEIRELANEMLKAAKMVSPILFEKGGPKCVKGSCSEGSMTCGKAVEIRKFYLDKELI
jgi:thymidylate synthase (FAD)